MGDPTYDPAMISPADPATWRPLVAAINDPGDLARGRGLAWDDGFAACLAAFGWTPGQIAALDAAALAQEAAAWAEMAALPAVLAEGGTG
ncbi:MAG TPA: hypothetical protein VH482_13385 [Thermomicrobiales bacterium]|jgi:hypothetical protein